MHIIKHHIQKGLKFEISDFTLQNFEALSS